MIPQILSALVLFVSPGRVYAAKNIVLFIGDGMGQAVVTATRVRYHGAAGSLEIERLSRTAFSKTYSADSVVTDSAAGATALATGQKVANDVISLSSSGALTSIAERAKAAGKAVGIVTTTRITHATPAAFYAHVKHRDLEDDIARQLLDSGFDLFLGGGLKKFDPEAVMKADKFEFVGTKAGLLKAASRSGKEPRKPILGLFNKDHLSFELDRSSGSEEPSLAEMTEAAVSVLSRDPDGFFLMVEGGKIDHAEHDNHPAEAMGEVRALDEAVAKALAAVSLKETLILVTADHETGGLALNGYPAHGEDLLKYPHLTFASGPGQRWSPPMALIEGASARHTGVDVPVYADGAGSELIHGVMENTSLFHVMAAALGR